MLHKVTRQDIAHKTCNIDIQEEKRIAEVNHISLIVCFLVKNVQKDIKIKDISHRLIFKFEGSVNTI